MCCSYRDDLVFKTLPVGHPTHPNWLSLTFLESKTKTNQLGLVSAQRPPSRPDPVVLLNPGADSNPHHLVKVYITYLSKRPQSERTPKLMLTPNPRFKVCGLVARILCSTSNIWVNTIFHISVPYKGNALAISKHQKKWPFATSKGRVYLFSEGYAPSAVLGAVNLMLGKNWPAWFLRIWFRYNHTSIFQFNKKETQ
jgi:hypothetical protein